MQELHEKVVDLLQLQRYSASTNSTRMLKKEVFEESVNKCRAAIRKSGFLTQASVKVGDDLTFFTMNGESHVHPDVKELTVKPLVKRQLFIQCSYLGHDPLSNPKLNHHVFTTYAQFDKVAKLSSHMKSTIEELITAEISKVNDPLIREVLWVKYHKEYRGKTKTRLLEMVDILNDMMQPEAN